MSEASSVELINFINTVFVICSREMSMSEQKKEKEIEQEIEEEDQEEEEHVCTYCLSGDTLIHQEIFTCETCNTQRGAGVQCFCAGCAASCHRGHQTRPIAFGQAYCE